MDNFFTAREAAEVRQFANCIEPATSVDHNQLNLFSRTPSPKRKILTPQVAWKSECALSGGTFCELETFDNRFRASRIRKDIHRRTHGLRTGAAGKEDRYYRDQPQGSVTSLRRFSTRGDSTRARDSRTRRSKDMHGWVNRISDSFRSVTRAIRTLRQKRSSVSQSLLTVLQAGVNWIDDRVEVLRCGWTTCSLSLLTMHRFLICRTAFGMHG